MVPLPNRTLPDGWRIVPIGSSDGQPASPYGTSHGFHGARGDSFPLESRTGGSSMPRCSTYQFAAQSGCSW